MITYLLSIILHLSAFVHAKNVRSPTPPLGWNSYNAYGCQPSENIITSNAKGLVDLGLANLGYTRVTTDCGWLSRNRDSQGRLQWNSTLFPSGPHALGDYLHGLGLKFGLYSGGGYFQCGSTDQPASKGHEVIDSQTFSDWGGDSLKYDNCYAVSPDVMVDNQSEESISPTRFQTMANAIDAVERDFEYYVCQWGIGYNIGTWASAIGNTWRISNDIYNAWRSIWRITNEVVPYWKHTKAGAFADMDMLINGLGALSYEEERFHFSMWAINKSPLILGAKINSASTTKESFDIVKNEEVIAINQDSLASQARLVRRHTVEEWDIWLGELSNSRFVLGVANWKNNSQTVQVDLNAIGIRTADARDVWAKRNLGSVSGVQTINLVGHELKLWTLSNVFASTPLQSAGYYAAAKASLSGSATITTCGSGECLPSGQKVGYIGSGAAVTFSSVSAKSAGTKVLGVDFVQYDIATDSAWGWGDNTRNLTIAVNGGTPKRWAFPISGGDWLESDRLLVEVGGFVQGARNQVVIRNVGSAWAPDLVGFDVLE
ncbi:alpha-galactosidase precursor [Bisporella sp. PMI_857]|nr:alpha-galactosidase precursor [Bisporella sp. PMI_857]